jgi:hypothetical protein
MEMKKKIAGFIVAGIAVFALSGCGGGDDYYYYDDPVPPVIVEPELVTLFLIDELGIGVEYVPYICYAPDGSIVTDTVTPINGEFSFVPGDRCEFDLFGFPNGIDFPLYIADIDGFGKDDIPYNCINDFNEYTEGVTDFDGWFVYPVDAYCKFYL